MPRTRPASTAASLPRIRLQRRVSVAEAEAAHLVSDEQLGPSPVPFGFMHTAWLALLAQMQPDDELWELRSPASTWQHLCGREGLVLLRQGKVVAQVLTAMN